MYRLDEDAVQPEAGGPERAYYDPAKAKLQRDCWIKEAKEDLEIECNREHYADELFPELPPEHPDDEEPDGTSESESDGRSSSDQRSSAASPMPSCAVSPGDMTESNIGEENELPRSPPASGT
eukprot:1578614-Pleurochrysis_carterae.AAC.1